MSIGPTRGTPVLRYVLSLALIATLIPALAAGSVAAQSSDESYDFEGGQTITWGNDWEIDESSAMIDGDVESVLFFRNISVLSVLSVPNDFDLNEARDIFLDSFLEAVGKALTIDRGSYGEVSYSLDLVNSEGFESGAFTLFRAGSGATPTFAYVFFSDVSIFADEFSSAQSSFLLDGEGLFDGVDGEGLQDLLEDNAGIAVPASDEQGDDGDGPFSLSADEFGLVGTNGYLSPQYDLDLVWGESWQLNDFVEEPVVSDVSTGIDSISLAAVDGGAIITVTLIDAEDVTVRDLIAVWESDEFVESVAVSPEAEVLLSDSSRDVGAVVLRDFFDDGAEIVVIREAHLIDDVLVVVLYNGFPGDAQLHIPSAQEEIALDGEPVLAFFTIEEHLDEF